MTESSAVREVGDSDYGLSGARMRAVHQLHNSTEHKYRPMTESSSARKVSDTDYGLSDAQITELLRKSE